MEYIVKCNKFDTKPESCRFYVLEQEGERNTGNRWKVHVDGDVDFKSVKGEFKKLGQDVTEADLKKAHEGA